MPDFTISGPLRLRLPRWEIFRLVALALLLSLPLRAHDIYSSWAEARLLPDKLEVTLTLARSCAHDLLPDARQLPAITPETFSAVAPRLKSAARDLIRISAAGKPLALLSADAKLGGDTDVTFTLTYARPAAGPLRFIADYLGQLVDGHVATFVVSDAAGQDLGWSPLSIDQPVFQVPLTAVPPKTTAPRK